MQEKTVVIVSTLVDATIREYSADTEFLIFKTALELGKYIDTTPIRATTMFVTEDTLGQTNTTLSYIKDLTVENPYLSVDRFVFIVTENSTQHVAVKYLIEQFSLTNWEVILGTLSKAYVTEVINGTYREDNYERKYKAVYRVPRRDYVKDELNRRESLQEEYVDDDNDLKDIPDEEVPEQPLPERDVNLDKCYIAGYNCEERAAFAFLAAQYKALSGKTIIVESDPDYHTITEYATKSGIDCYLIEIDELYEDLAKALDNIRNSKERLVVVGAINRTDFSYNFIIELLYYNLLKDVDYLVCEIPMDQLPLHRDFTLVVPSTMRGMLTIGEQLDRMYYRNAKMIGVNLKYLPEIHLNSGVVMSMILRDLLSDNSILCPVVTISSLKLNGSAYDLGAVLNGGY